MYAGLTFKKIVLRIFFAGEIVMMVVCYCTGAHGIPALMRLRREQKLLSTDITQLRAQVSQLEQDIDEWHKDPFYREKIAREQLHMARANDIIFYSDIKD